MLNITRPKLLPAGVLLAYFTYWVAVKVSAAFSLFDMAAPENWNLLPQSPAWVQFVVFFILADFLEWCVHNLLHRISWMWEFHKLHHSITIMDWIGNFRFHWMEILIYRTFKYLPLIILGPGEGITITTGSYSACCKL